MQKAVDTKLLKFKEKYKFRCRKNAERTQKERRIKDRSQNA